MIPVNVISIAIQEIENIGPVTMVSLQNIKFAPHELFHGQNSEFLTTNTDGASGTSEPCVINLGPLIGHGPNDVHDTIVFKTAINPFAIVAKASVIVFKASATKRFHYAISFVRTYIKINVF